LAGAWQPSDKLNKETLNQLKDINGVTFACQLYGNNTSIAWNAGGTVVQAQVGKGTSPPSRQDLDIENPFTNGGNEDNRNSSLFGSYSNVTELITMQTTIVPIGSGSITEVCKFVQVNDTGIPTLRIILISRDLISPPVAFNFGDVINVQNEVST